MPSGYRRRRWRATFLLGGGRVQMNPGRIRARGSGADARGRPACPRAERDETPDPRTRPRTLRDATRNRTNRGSFFMVVCLGEINPTKCREGDGLATALPGFSNASGSVARDADGAGDCRVGVLERGAGADASRDRSRVAVQAGGSVVVGLADRLAGVRQALVEGREGRRVAGRNRADAVRAGRVAALGVRVDGGGAGGVALDLEAAGDVVADEVVRVLDERAPGGRGLGGGRGT